MARVRPVQTLWPPTSGQSAAHCVELIDAYVKHARQYYGEGPNSELHRIVRVMRSVRKLYGRKPARSFDALKFRAVRQVLIGEGLSRSFINASMRRVIRMFRWAVGEGKLPPRIPQALAMVPGLKRGRTDARETDPILPVADSMVDATLPFLPQVVADMVRLQRLTGMRPAEVCMLRPRDIDRSDSVWLYQPRTHKTAHHGRSRTICIGPKAQQILSRYLARDEEMQCFRPCDSEAKRRAAAHAERTTPQSCGNKPGSNRKRRPARTAGTEYTTCSYGRAIARACLKAFPAPSDLTDPVEVAVWARSHRWSPNQLRHSAGTAIRKQFGLEAAQVTLGHSRANVTEVYAERDLSLAVQVARLVG